MSHSFLNNFVGYAIALSVAFGCASQKKPSSSASQNAINNSTANIIHVDNKLGVKEPYRVVSKDNVNYQLIQNYASDDGRTSVACTTFVTNADTNNILSPKELTSVSAIVSSSDTGYYNQFLKITQTAKEKYYNQADISAYRFRDSKSKKGTGTVEVNTKLSVALAEGVYSYAVGVANKSLSATIDGYVVQGKNGVVTEAKKTIGQVVSGGSAAWIANVSNQAMERKIFPHPDSSQSVKAVINQQIFTDKTVPVLAGSMISYLNTLDNKLIDGMAYYRLNPKTKMYEFGIVADQFLPKDKKAGQPRTNQDFVVNIITVNDKGKVVQQAKEVDFLQNATFFDITALESVNKNGLKPK
jgi:hypothetical protein